MLAAAARAATGDPAAALNALEQARKLAPLRADVHQRTGDIAASVGDFDGAIAAYRHALELDQDYAVVRFQLARLLRGKGMLREAGFAIVASGIVADDTRAISEMLMRWADLQDIPLIVTLRSRMPSSAARATCWRPS